MDGERPVTHPLSLQYRLAQITTCSRPKLHPDHGNITRVSGPQAILITGL